jgi:hypothetical protein
LGRRIREDGLMILLALALILVCGA